MLNRVIIFVLFFILFGCKNEPIKERISLSTRFIDVSQYQGDIKWGHIPDSISNVFIRCSMGIDGEDNNFYYNYKQAKHYGFSIGVYHYYRPNENSLLQANNFINIFGNKELGLPIVLDIEAYSTIQSSSKLKEGILNWLHIIERKYGKRPVIYTGDNFYINNFIEDDRFDKYNFWIANYSRYPESNFIYWQYTQRGIISGINSSVDINLFKVNKK